MSDTPYPPNHEHGMMPMPPTLYHAFDGVIGELPDGAVWDYTLDKWVVPVEPDYQAAMQELYEWLQEPEGITELPDCVKAIVDAALGVDDE